MIILVNEVDKATEINPQSSLRYFSNNSKEIQPKLKVESKLLKLIWLLKEPRYN
jgi:hypothetical protein